MLTRLFVRRTAFLVVLIAIVTCAGLASAGEAKPADKTAGPAQTSAIPQVPRELSMRPLPAYRIDPPDVLQIEIISSKGAPKTGSQAPAPPGLQPKSGAKTPEPASGGMCAGATRVSGGSPIAPCPGAPDKSGTIEVGAGAMVIDSVKVGTGGPMFGGTLTVVGPSGGALAASNAPPTAAAYPGDRLTLDCSNYTAAAATTSGGPTSGCYLVAPDGTVNLRRYGTVQVSGKTIAEAKAALEKHLAKYLDSPEVVVEVACYNSKVYYVITEGAGLGDNVRRIPITGNETVLDAMSHVNGLSQVSSKKMWISRPCASDPKKGVVLPVDWDAIVRHGATATNYQIMPGDRIFIESDPLVALNNAIGKNTAPVERILGVISLGLNTFRSLLPQQ